MALRYMHGDEEAARCALDMLGESGDGGKVITFSEAGVKVVGLHHLSSVMGYIQVLLLC